VRAPVDLHVAPNDCHGGPKWPRTPRAGNGNYLIGEPSQHDQENTWLSEQEDEKRWLRGKGPRPLVYANANDLQRGVRKGEEQSQIAKSAFDVFSDSSHVALEWILLVTVNRRRLRCVGRGS
jgi:hypothetical protein